MKTLSNELIRQFPEIADIPGSAQDPTYVLFENLVNWLDKNFEDELPQHDLNRLIDFNNWCLEQPRGTDADDDVYTFLVVGLYETLIEHEKLRALVPCLIPRSEFLNSRDYLERWAGKNQYSKTLEIYNSGKFKKKSGPREFKS